MLEILLDKIVEFLDKYSFIPVIGFFVGWIFIPWLMILSGILLAVQVGIPDGKEFVANIFKFAITKK